MLKIFQTEPPYDLSEAQLKVFLNRLVHEDKVNCSGNNEYSIKKHAR